MTDCFAPNPSKAIFTIGFSGNKHVCIVLGDENPTFDCRLLIILLIISVVWLFRLGVGDSRNVCKACISLINFAFALGFDKSYIPTLPSDTRRLIDATALFSELVF